VLHFNKGELLPVHGFWSHTKYDSQYFFVPKSPNRYTLSQGTSSWSTLMDMFVPPGRLPGPSKGTNFLPAPKADFIPTLRRYWPNKVATLNSGWLLDAAGNQGGPLNRR